MRSCVMSLTLSGLRNNLRASALLACMTPPPHFTLCNRWNKSTADGLSLVGLSNNNAVSERILQVERILYYQGVAYRNIPSPLAKSLQATRWDPPGTRRHAERRPAPWPSGTSSNEKYIHAHTRQPQHANKQACWWLLTNTWPLDPSMHGGGGNSGICATTLIACCIACCMCVVYVCTAC